MRGAPGDNVTVAWLPPAAHAELRVVATSVIHTTCELGVTGQAVMHVSSIAKGNQRLEKEWHVECE